MKGLLIHPVTDKHLKNLAGDAPQAILLQGETGVGLGTIAINWAKNISARPATVSIYAPNENGTLTIETVRSLYVATRTRHENIRTIVIDDVDSMGIDAQNAFLKLLEEPNSSTRFILTSHDPQKLLPTVLSRLVPVNVLPVSSETSRKFLESNGDMQQTLKTQILFIASGLPAEINRLAQNMDYQKQKLERAVMAKRFISGTRFDQLALINKLTVRDVAIDVIGLSLRMLRTQLAKAQDKTVLSKISDFMAAEEFLNQNGHVRSQLLRLVN